MSAPEALAMVASINVADIVNSQSFNVYPNNELATVQVGADNLNIQITVANQGADGTLYLILRRDDNVVLLNQEQAVVSGSTGLWQITTDMPNRNVSFTVEVGHVLGPSGQYTLSIVNTSVGGEGYTEPVGDVTQAAGSALTVYAYFTTATYVWWYLDGALIAEGVDNVTVTFDANHVLTAEFY